jgi:hypothetical protein
LTKGARRRAEGSRKVVKSVEVVKVVQIVETVEIVEIFTAGHRGQITHITNNG